MIVNVNNKSHCKNIILNINGSDYNISDKKFVSVETGDSVPVKAKVIINDKSTVNLDFVDLFLGVLDHNSSNCKIKCSYAFEIISEADCCNIDIFDLQSNKEENIVFESVYAQSYDALISTVDYFINDIKFVKRKFYLLQLFVLSSLPIIILLFILLMKNNSFILLAAVILDLFFVVFPSLRKIKNFNEICSYKYAKNALICSENKNRC